jgi:hypothetical protein
MHRDDARRIGWRIGWSTTTAVLTAPLIAGGVLERREHAHGAGDVGEGGAGVIGGVEHVVNGVCQA